MMCYVCKIDKPKELMVSHGKENKCKQCRNEKIRSKKPRKSFIQEKWRPEPEFFLDRAKKVKSGCWEWLSHINKHGYGVYTRNGIRETAHRASYRIFKGIIGEGKLVCHKCDNRKCVNPDHLYEGTWKSNMKDRSDRGRENFVCGEESPNAKLTEKQIPMIMKEKGSYQKIANKYGVSWGTIRCVKLGLSWKHVKR